MLVQLLSPNLNELLWNYKQYRYRGYRVLCSDPGKSVGLFMSKTPVWKKCLGGKQSVEALPHLDNRKPGIKTFTL